jgi:hypothetical protein
MPASDDAGKPSPDEILAALREAGKNAPEPRPPTPEERAEAEAQGAQLRKTILGAAGVEHDRLRLPAVTISEAGEAEPGSLGEAQVEIIAAGVAKALEGRQELDKLKPGVKPTDVPTGTKKKVAELRLRGAGIAEIGRETKLSKTIATRLVHEIDALLAKLKAGRY